MFNARAVPVTTGFHPKLSVQQDGQPFETPTISLNVITSLFNSRRSTSLWHVTLRCSFDSSPVPAAMVSSKRSSNTWPAHVVQRLGPRSLQAPVTAAGRLRRLLHPSTVPEHRQRELAYGTSSSEWSGWTKYFKEKMLILRSFDLYSYNYLFYFFLFLKNEYTYTI